MSLAIALSNDPVYNLLASGEMLWGDIADLCIPATAVKTTETTVEAVVAGEESDSVPVGPAEDGFYYIDEWDLFHNWDMPDLKLRKNIWENFPVSLLPLPNTDGTDRYSIVWHEKNLRDWRTTRCQSMDEHECYEEFCRARLLRALEAHAHKYRVEPAHGHRQICVIAMVHSDTIATTTTVAPATTVTTAASVVAPAATAVVTVASGKKALDVLKSAPVSWDRDGKIHFIKPHMKKLRDLGRTANDITFDLMEELSHCDDCVVSAATRKGDICVVTML